MSSLQGTAWPAAIVGAVLIAGSPVPLAAQGAGPGSATLSGVVEDRSLRTGVAAAALRLVLEVEGGDGPGPTFETVARTGGRFEFTGLPAGRYELSVRALGYQRVVQELTVTGDSHLLVGLVPQAVELDALVVLSRRSRTLESVGFYQRRESARSGSTFTREEITASGGYLTSDVLRNVPGVTIRRTRTETPVVLLRGGCRPDVVVDGINLGTGVLIDDLVRPADLEGLEVHRGGTMLFPFSNSRCGSVTAWTVDPSARDDGFAFSWPRLVTGVALGAFILLRMRAHSR